jgi:hypothetical protein
MKYFIFVLFCLILFCNCATYQYKSGKVKSFLPPRDQAKSFKKQFNLHDFDINNFEREIEQNTHFPYAEYFSPQSLNAFRTKYPKTLILFWNPGCGASKRMFLFAQKLDSINIPVVLVSINYLLPNIIANIQNSRFKNRVIYILTPNHERTNIVISKIRTFAKEACSVCYEEYKDQLRTTEAIMVTKDSIELFFRINEEEIEDKIITK